MDRVEVLAMRGDAGPYGGKSNAVQDRRLLVPEAAASGLFRA